MDTFLSGLSARESPRTNLTILALGGLIRLIGPSPLEGRYSWRFSSATPGKAEPFTAAEMRNLAAAGTILATNLVQGVCGQLDNTN
jgi:hypothetical protein